MCAHKVGQVVPLFRQANFVPTWHEFLNSEIMMREADPRVGFFSVLEVMTSAKEAYRTATENGFKSHFPAAGTEQKLFEGGEKQNKHISLLSPGNRRNDQFSMDFYRYRVCRFGSLHGLYGDKIARLAALRGAVSVPGKRGQKAQPMSLQA